MAITIIVRSGDAPADLSITFDAPRIVIGRAEGSEVLLPDPSVSHRHASIQQRGSEYILMDEGSTNGTFAGPVRLSPKAPRVLRSGDRIRVGRIWLEVKLENAAATQRPGVASHEIALRLVAAALQAQGEPHDVQLRVIEGPDAPAQCSLSDFDTPYVLGRSPQAHLQLSDPDASRRHVQLVRRGTGLWARDLGSKNGSHLGGLPLSTEKDRLWTRDTTLEVGQNKFRFEDPVAVALTELERTSDEQVPEDEPIEPPHDRALDTDEDVFPTGSSAPEPTAPEPESAPTRPPRAGSNGWRPVDLLVALVSVLVLAFSLLGLVWLFQAR